MTNVRLPSSAAAAAANVVPEPYVTDFGILTSGNAVTLNHIRGVRYRWPKNGTVTGLALFLTATSGNFTVGVYDLAATNLNLLRGSASTVAGGASAWQGVDLSSGLVVVGGDDVYLVVHTDNSTVAFGRSGALVSNNAQGPFPAGYMSGADGLLRRSWDFDRGSYSSPLPNTISVASISSNAPVVFAVKYA